MLTQSKIAAKESLVDGDDAIAIVYRIGQFVVKISRSASLRAALISITCSQISQRRTRPQALGRKNEQGRENLKNWGKRDQANTSDVALSVACTLLFCCSITKKKKNAS